MTTTGTVKWFNSDKGYGFIAGDDGIDAFYHISDWPSASDPIERERVRYEVPTDHRGRKRADKIELI